MRTIIVRPLGRVCAIGVLNSGRMKIIREFGAYFERDNFPADISVRPNLDRPIQRITSRNQQPRVGARVENG
jgi:hypothetical protein